MECSVAAVAEFLAKLKTKQQSEHVNAQSSQCHSSSLSDCAFIVNEGWASEEISPIDSTISLLSKSIEEIQ